VCASVPLFVQLHCITWVKIVKTETENSQGLKESYMYSIVLRKYIRLCFYKKFKLKQD